MNSKLIRVAAAFLILAAASGAFFARNLEAQDNQGSDQEKVIYCEVVEEDGTASVWEVDSVEVCKSMGGKVVSGQ